MWRPGVRSFIITSSPAMDGLPESFGGPSAMARRSAGSAVNGRAKTRCSDRFLAGLTEASSVIFVSHVQPDPDALASMMGLVHLVETCLDKPTRLTQDGIIGRAENAAMVKLLHIDLQPIEEVSWCAGDVRVMVDS